MKKINNNIIRKFIKKKRYDLLTDYLIKINFNLLDLDNNKKLDSLFSNIYEYNKNLELIKSQDFTTYLPRGLGASKRKLDLIEWLKDEEDFLNAKEINKNFILFIKNLNWLNNVKEHLSHLDRNNVNNSNSIYIQSYIIDMEGIVRTILS